MTPGLAQLAIGAAVKLALLMVLVGVLRRGLHRRCWSFLVYLLAVLIYSTAEFAAVLADGHPGWVWPALLWSWDFWNFQQSTYEVIKLAVAVELMVRVVAAFPGTWRLARVLVGLMLTSTTLVVATGGTLRHPLLATATVWLLAGVSLVVAVFHLPMRAWHRALLLGFVPYLFVFSTIQSILSRRGQPAAEALGRLDQIAYLVLVSWWIYAAWRGEERVEGIEPALLRRLGLSGA